MALQKPHITHYLSRAKEYGFPDTHPLLMRIKKGDESAAKELNDFFTQFNETKQKYDPYTDERFGVKKYGQSAIPGYAEPEGSFLWGKDAWRENVPTMTPDQMKYVDLMRQLSGDTLQKGLGSIDEKLNMGFLDQLIGKGSSKGFEGLLGQLGEYAPQAIGSAVGSYSSGGGIGDILSSLIGSAISQYGVNKVAPSVQGYANQGMDALRGLYGNNDQVRR